MKYSLFLFIIYTNACFLLTFLSNGSANAQIDESRTGVILGRTVLEGAGQTLADVPLTIPELKKLVHSDAAGNFIFNGIPYGRHTLIIGGQGMRADTIKISVHAEVTDLQDLQVSVSDSIMTGSSSPIPTILLEDARVSSDDEGMKERVVSSLLSASRDPFSNAAAYVFSAYRFRPRGYGHNNQEIQVNGSPMNDPETGDAYPGQWAGLNDVFRGRSNTYGLQPSQYAFDGINGGTYLDATAYSQRKQTRVTYSATDRNYRNRISLTRSSGLMSNGGPIRFPYQNAGRKKATRRALFTMDILTTAV